MSGKHGRRHGRRQGQHAAAIRVTRLEHVDGAGVGQIRGPEESCRVVLREANAVLAADALEHRTELVGLASARQARGGAYKVGPE